MSCSSSASALLPSKNLQIADPTTRPGVRYAVLCSTAHKQDTGSTIIDGIPFLENPAWALDEGQPRETLKCGNVRASYLYLFGCTASPDRPHYNWGGADASKIQLLGESIGSVLIRYASGTIDRIPLMFGYTIWWREGYNVSPEPFESDPAKQAVLNRALSVANGIRAGGSPYYLRILLRTEPVHTLALRGISGYACRAVFNGITFGNVLRGQLLTPGCFVELEAKPISSNNSAWLAHHTVSSTDPLPANQIEALRALKRVIYTFPSDITLREVKQALPIASSGFPGPAINFAGPAEATILTNVLLDNAIGLLGRIDNDTGMVHESAVGAPNYMGWVGYKPDLGLYYGDSYTRTHFIALLSNMGFITKAEAGIDYFDRWMMYFPKSYPKLQMGGGPVPGHATVIANKPHYYFDVLSKRNWRTKFKTRDYGNPETDGHGLLMLSRWRTWAKSGRTPEWVEARWESLHEAAEWIPWCLDHPELSLSEHGLLYSESEGGMEMESLYCNVPCYFGLLGYAEMAKVAGKEESAGRWSAQADRLLAAMNSYFPQTLATWGDVWDPEKVGGWGPATACVPIFEAAELHGYDAINRLPAGWADRTKRTYAMQSSKILPRYCNPSALGYGQGFITETALLLDQMDDATHMTEWMARFCFAPRQQYPFRVPESAVLKPDGSMWARGGDLGNGFQMGEVLLVCQIILGIDDYDEHLLKLMPRLPLGWNQVNISKWPVRVLSSGKSQMALLSLTVERNGHSKRCNVKLSFDMPIDNVALRLGPFPIDSRTVTVKVNRSLRSSTLFRSGDSKWIWVQLGPVCNLCVVESQVE